MMRYLDQAFISIPLMTPFSLLFTRSMTFTLLKMRLSITFQTIIVLLLFNTMVFLLFEKKLIIKVTIISMTTLYDPLNRDL